MKITNKGLNQLQKPWTKILLVVDVGSLEKRSNQPKYKEPRTRSPQQARSRFARSTIPKEKWGTTRSLIRTSFFKNLGSLMSFWYHLHKNLLSLNLKNPGSYKQGFTVTEVSRQLLADILTPNRIVVTRLALMMNSVYYVFNSYQLIHCNRRLYYLLCTKRDLILKSPVSQPGGGGGTPHMEGVGYSSEILN